MHNGGNHHAGSVLPLECRSLTIERNARRLLDGIDLGFEEGGVSAILGPNGAGKSLLLRALAGLIRPDRGAVSWAGKPPERERVVRIGLVFQKPVLLRRSVLQNMTYGLMASGVEPRERRLSKAAHMLGIAGLSHLARAPARVLSGGEQQRLAMARALAMEPEVLLLDEPTSSLDPASAVAIEGLIEQAASAATKVVLVTHDLGQVRRLADEVVFMHHGRVLERAATPDFCASPRAQAARAFVEGRIPL